MAVIFDGCVMMFCFEQMNYWCLLASALIGTIPKPNSSPLKMDGWNTIDFPFGASKGLFSGAFAVGFREGKNWWDFFGVSFGEILNAKRWTKTSG